MAIEFISGQVKTGGLGDRLRALFSSDHPNGSMLRGAAFAFAIRVTSAALALISQALLARWIGSHEYGLFAYVYVWVIVLGTLSPLGMNSSILRFIPEYAEHKDHGKLRGILLTGGLVSFIAGTVLAVAGATGLYIFGDHISSQYLAPFYLAFILLPMFSFTEYQEGVGRAWSWIDLALIPPYIIRPVLLLGFLAVAVGLGAAADVKSAFLAAIAAAWCVVGIQFVLLRRRLNREIKREKRQFNVSLWIKVSLPLLLVEGFSLLLTNTDIMMMSRYLPPESVGHYYAAVKITGLIGFVYYAVVAVTAQRISALNVSGDRGELEALVRRSAHWTFWPSLAGAAGILLIGWPVLWMFGDDFTHAYPVMFILATGLLARAAVGPLDFVLNMLGHQNLCATILGAGALVNIVLNAILIKHYGLYGAAAATSTSLALISVMLLAAVDRRIGFHFLPWRWRSYAATLCAEDDIGCIAVQDIDLSREQDLQQIQQSWQDLMQRSMAANPVFGADMVMPALSSLPKQSAKLRALCLWGQAGAGKERRLVGFIPYQNKRLVPGLGPKIMTAWHHQYGFCTLPLFDGERGSKVIEAWLDWIGASGRLIRLPMAADGRMMKQISTACAAKSMSYDWQELYSRAVMRPAPENPGYLNRSMSKQRRKTLRRQQRQIAQLGEIRFEQLGPDGDIDSWIGAFEALEAKGWKGRAGSAMGSQAPDRAFFEQTMSRSHRAGRLRFYRLMKDDAPIAMSMAFDWDGQLFFFKMCYDEQLRRYSPGMLLFAEITELLDTDSHIRMADSCSSPAHPLLDHMWSERRVIGDVLIGGGGKADQILFTGVAALINVRRRLSAALKRVYYRLRSKPQRRR